jgi:hypothetical protein
MGSGNSIENERCGFEIGLVFESIFKRVEIGLNSSKQRAEPPFNLSLAEAKSLFQGFDTVMLNASLSPSGS